MFSLDHAKQEAPGEVEWRCPINIERSGLHVAAGT